MTLNRSRFAVPITLSADHRDALYELILDRLSGLDDLWRAIDRDDFETAGRLGREFSDDLRLILDDLGWIPSEEPVTLTLPAADLQRIFSTLRDHAVKGMEMREDELDEQRRFLERSELVTDACDQVLSAVSGG
jgi:hypothetical protein